MSTLESRHSAGEEGPVRVDAALRQTVALLELVRQEEALLGWLNECVAQLRAVHQARQHLLDVTDAELAEAGQHATRAQHGVGEAASDGEVGS